MTEKRFKVIREVYIVYSDPIKAYCIGNNKYNFIMLDINEKGGEWLCDKLNNIIDENAELKFELKECREHKLFSRRQLEEENEQLKKELKVYRKIATCGNCNYHNYDWFDDGDEFEVCDKGNDTSNMICEDWEELE